MTSSKDIVILLDTSSSLSESSRRLARITAKTILDTLGDNDFVNVFSLDSSDQVVVPCFKDLLVQVSSISVTIVRFYNVLYLAIPIALKTYTFNGRLMVAKIIIW